MEEEVVMKLSEDASSSKTAPFESLGKYSSLKSSTDDTTKDFDRYFDDIDSCLSYDSITTSSDGVGVDTVDLDLYLYSPITAMNEFPVVVPGRDNIPWYSWAIESLTFIIKTQHIEHKKRGLRTLKDLFFNPRWTSLALKVKDFNQLCARVTKSQSSTIRLEIGKAFLNMTYNSVGRLLISELLLFEPILILLEDELETVRICASQTLYQLSMCKNGVVAIHSARLVEILFETLFQLKFCSQIYLLDCLHNVFSENCEIAIRKNYNSLLLPFLESTNEELKGKALRLIYDLSVPVPGKEQLIQLEVLPKLLELLDQEDDFIRRMASGVIMMIATITAGKRLCFEKDVITVALSLIDEESTELRLNALKIIALVGELPVGRAFLLSYVDVVQKKCCDGKPSVRKAAKTAVKIIQWQPE